MLNIQINRLRFRVIYTTDEFKTQNWDVHDIMQQLLLYIWLGSLRFIVYNKYAVTITILTVLRSMQ